MAAGTVSAGAPMQASPAAGMGTLQRSSSAAGSNGGTRLLAAAAEDKGTREKMEDVWVANINAEPTSAVR